MVKDRRQVFIEKWFARAASEEDPFDRFFCLWIALIVAAQQLRTKTGSWREDDTDRKKILDYFRANIYRVFEALKLNNDRMMKLAGRRGTRYNNPIVDSGNRKLQDRFARMSQHYAAGLTMSEVELVETTGELLNKIRNNLFHGLKVYDDREDVLLLELVNPLLESILRNCEYV